MAVAIAVIFAAIFSLLTLAILALFGMGVCSLTTKGRCTMLGKILLGVLGALFSLLMLVALSWTVLVFSVYNTCEPECEDVGGEWFVAGLSGLVIASLTGTLAFTFWRATYRRLRGHGTLWWWQK
jgi:hypothetical protein